MRGALVVVAMIAMSAGCAETIPAVDTCADDTDCATGWVCRTGECVKLCNACDDCTSKTQACDNGLCVERLSPQCSTDADCQTPDACEGLPGRCCGGSCQYTVTGCGAACSTQICDGAGAECGPILDACGGSVDCGGCSGGQPCGADMPNQCSTCTPESAATFCTRLGKNCDMITGTDNCGQLRTEDCGMCVLPETCGGGPGGGVLGVCGDDNCVAETDPAFCARLVKNCGLVTDRDNCGTLRTVNCDPAMGPQCPGSECCGCGNPTGTPNVCGMGACTPDCNSKTCGESDGCTGTCMPGSGCCERMCDGVLCGTSDGCTGTCTAGPDNCCDNDCTPVSSTRCPNGTQVDTCGDYDADACLEWGNRTTCASGVCSGTNCCTPNCGGKTCGQDDGCGTACIVNDCSNGQTRCNGAQIETCIFSSGCWGWGAAASCGGSLTCYMDACCDDNCDTRVCGTLGDCGANCTAGSGCCTNECSNGQTRCNSTLIETCQFNSPCWEWGSPTSCGGGDVCDGGACCTPESVPAFCGSDCGLKSGTDNCGQFRSNVDCGVCPCPTAPASVSIGQSPAGNGTCDRNGLLADGGAETGFFDGGDSTTIPIDGVDTTACVAVDLGVECSPSLITLEIRAGVNLGGCSDTCGGVCQECLTGCDTIVQIFSNTVNSVGSYLWESTSCANLPPVDYFFVPTYTPLRWLYVCRGDCAPTDFNLYIDRIEITP